MSWPPDVGEILPNARSAYGVQEKLAGYSLKLEHESGGAKARAFARVLAITRDDLEYLADALLRGAQAVPISEVREGPQGPLCEVVSPVRGLRDHADRIANVLTSWEVRWEGDSPRLVTAFITTKIRR